MIGIAIAFAVILWVFVRHRALAIALSFLLIIFVWRLVGAAYLNYVGPIYSYEVEMLVGGNATSAADSFGLIIAISILVMIFAIRPNSLKTEITKIGFPSRPVVGFSLGDLVFIGALIFVVALYIEIIHIGVIPLLHCMERYEYLASYAGPFHKILFKYGPLIALQFGVFATYPRMVSGDYDWRFLFLVILIFFYMMLAGNRFSSYFSFMLFFLAPHSILWLLKSSPKILLTQKNASIKIKIIWLLSIIIVFCIVSFSLLHSYANVRAENNFCTKYSNKVQDTNNKLSTDNFGFSPDTNNKLSTDNFGFSPESKFFDGMLARFATPNVIETVIQRTMVQPIHLYFLTYERVIIQGDWKPREAADYIFNNDMKRAGNRSIRYLMIQTLPANRAAYLESVGNQFAGGYPEILLELLGKWGVWLGTVFFAAITGLLLGVWLRALIRARFMTAFFSAYVYYAFVVMYIGGMLNFLIVWTFWAKILLLIFFAFLESRLQARGNTLLPWILYKNDNREKRPC